MPAPPTCAHEAVLEAEEGAVDAAEEVDGVVDGAQVEEPDAEVEPDPDTDLEAHLGSEGFTEGRRLTRTQNQTTQTQNHSHSHSHYRSDLQTPVDDAEADELTGSA